MLGLMYVKGPLYLSLGCERILFFLIQFPAPSISNMADIEPGTVHIPSSISATQPTGGEASRSSGISSASESRGAGGKGKRPKLPSFWIPTLTPSAKPTEIKKPVR